MGTCSIQMTAAVLSAVLLGCPSSAERQAGQAPGASGTSEAGSPITLTAGDSGRTVPVAVGTDIVITLATTPGTGYSWVLTDSGTSALELVDTPTVPRDSAAAMRPGAPVTAAWRFRAARAGQATVTLDYRRPWERGTPAARQYEVGFEVR